MAWICFGSNDIPVIYNNAWQCTSRIDIVILKGTCLMPPGDLGGCNCDYPVIDTAGCGWDIFGCNTDLGVACNNSRLEALNICGITVNENQTCNLPNTTLELCTGPRSMEACGLAEICLTEACDPQPDFTPPGCSLSYLYEYCGAKEVGCGNPPVDYCGGEICANPSLSIQDMCVLKEMGIIFHGKSDHLDFGVEMGVNVVLEQDFDYEINLDL